MREKKTLVGVVITLRQDNKIVATAVTDKYTVNETNLAEVPLDVNDIDGGDYNRIAVELSFPKGFNSTGNDFVDENSRKIAGKALEDIGDIGDEPIPDAPVELHAVYEMGTSDFYGITQRPTPTATSSSHCVPPRKYLLIERTPEGYYEDM